MNKIINIFTVCTLLISACTSKNESPKDGYIIKGKLLSGGKGSKVKLEEIINEQLVLRDSANILDDSSYTLKGKLPEPGFYRISIGDLKPIYLALDNKEVINITVDDRQGAFEIKITGSKANIYMQQLNAMDADFQYQSSMLQKKYQEANSAKNQSEMNSSLDEYQKLSANFIKNLQGFIDTAQTNIVLLSAAQTYMRPETDMEYLTKLETRFKKELPNSTYTKKFSENLEQARNLSEGKMAPNFELNTPDNHKIKLSDLKGKVVLIDFWASWCKPCIATIPELKSIYNQYNTKGLEILGVSLDSEKSEWVGAIKKYDLNWKHASDLKEWKSIVQPLYRIEGIPYTVLVDKNGKIVAKNLRGKDLENKIKSLLK